MLTQIREMPINPWEEVVHYQETVLGRAGNYGATVVFVGTMREFSEDVANIQGMHLEHYPGMTEKHLETISEEARERWEVLDTLIVHRVGDLRPNDPIVLVAVWAAHRGAAFEAGRFLIEELKSRAPFWKKEIMADDQRWVEHNTSG